MGIRALLAALLVTQMTEAAQFDRLTIVQDVKGGYQVVPIDMNHDGRIDLLVVGTEQSDLVWYENPSWTRHVVASGFKRMINVAAKDLDGDGIPELVLAHEFSMEPSKSTGIVSLLHSNGDPRRLWKVREIDRLTTSHRLRWARLEGQDILVNAPLAGAGAGPPDFNANVPLVYYRPGEWKRELISDANRGVQHGVFVSHHGASDHILTASFSGIDHFQFISGKWERREMSGGDPEPCPKCGASDIEVGHAGGREFVATIEPWHGNQVAVYFERNHKWERQVIDAKLEEGHALVVGRLAPGHDDAIFAGWRGGQGGVKMFGWNGSKWIEQRIETGLPVSSCAIADLEHAGQPELVCTGGEHVTVFRPRAR